MEMMLGQWRKVKHENIHSLGYKNPVTAESFATARQTLHVTKDGEYFVCNIDTPMTGVYSFKFKEGQPYELSDVIHGKKTYITTMEGGKVYVRQQGSQFHRIFEKQGDTLVMSIKMGNNKYVKIYYDKDSGTEAKWLTSCYIL